GSGGSGTRRDDDAGRLGEERPCEPVEWIALAGSARQEPAQRARFLRGHAHALTPHRIEPAHRVADDEQTGGKRFEPLVVTVNAFGKSVADDVTHTLGVSNGVVDRRHPKALDERHEHGFVPRRIVTVPARDREDPASAFEW